MLAMPGAVLGGLLAWALAPRVAGLLPPVRDYAQFASPAAAGGDSRFARPALRRGHDALLRARFGSEPGLARVARRPVSAS